MMSKKVSDECMHPMEARPHYCVMHGVSFLCTGNLNPMLSYHEAWTDLLEEWIVRCDLRADAEQHLERWIEQLKGIGRKTRKGEYKVVKVEFRWNTAFRRKGGRT